MESEPPQQAIAGPYMALVLIWSTTPLAIVLSLRNMNALWALALYSLQGWRDARRVRLAQ